MYTHILTLYDTALFFASMYVEKCLFSPVNDGNVAYNLANLPAKFCFETYDIPSSGFPKVVLTISGWSKPTLHITAKLGAF